MCFKYKNSNYIRLAASLITNIVNSDPYYLRSSYNKDPLYKVSLCTRLIDYASESILVVAQIVDSIIVGSQGYISQKTRIKLVPNFQNYNKRAFLDKVPLYISNKSRSRSINRLISSKAQNRVEIKILDIKRVLISLLSTEAIPIDTEQIPANILRVVRNIKKRVEFGVKITPLIIVFLIINLDKTG